MSINNGCVLLRRDRSDLGLLLASFFSVREKQPVVFLDLNIGADLSGAVGADAPIDGRLMGAVHP